VIFLWTRYLVDIGPPDVNARYWDENTTQAFYTQMKRINNRCPNLGNNPKFQERTAADFMDQNGGAGCVLIMIDGDLRNVTPDLPGDGIYRGPDYMDRNDHWSNKGNMNDLSSDQLKEYPGRRTSSAGGRDEFFISQWLLTPDAITSTIDSLEALAIWMTNPALYFSGLMGMDPEGYPSVLLQDYIGVELKGKEDFGQLTTEPRVFAIGLNLYLASENCYVSHRKHPFFKSNAKVAAAQVKIASLSNGTSSAAEDHDVTPNGFPQWNGIIFANGTVIDHPKPDLHPWRLDTLRPGTRFANGTMVTKAVRNPGLALKLTIA
jgi:hypothetical protein